MLVAISPPSTVLSQPYSPIEWRRQPGYHLQPYYGAHWVHDDAVWAIALDSSGKPLIGGTFTTINGTPINRIARLNTDGSLDTTFNPGSGIDNAVLAIALDSSGKLLVGGQFNKVNGIVRPSIARLNSDGSLDTTFNAGSVDGAVQAIALDSSGKPVIGGGFTTINGTNRNRIARLNTDGSVDDTFNAGAIDGDVYAIALDSSDKPFIGGPFTTINGTARNRIARLNTDGSVDNDLQSW
jgi:uncharacterized delta-60 repeat protein